MNESYVVAPGVVIAGGARRIRIERGQEGRRLPASANLVVEVLYRKDYTRREVCPATVRTAEGGIESLEITVHPAWPGEYLVHLGMDGRRWPGQGSLDLCFFAVSPALRGMLPWKGDMHMHTFHSDGEQSAAVMAARCVQAGMDFAAITDHRVYESSVEAVDRARELDFDILMIPGEECNYCIGLGHVLSYGAREGISSRLLSESPWRSWSEVDAEDKLAAILDWAYPKVEKEIAGVSLPPDVDRRMYGFYAWIVAQIHNAGGLAVAAHPHWTSQRVVDLVTPLYRAVLANRLVDAVEVFGDVDFEDNMLALAVHARESAAGNHLPIWASSDSHSVDSPTFGRIWTVAFCRERTQPSLFEAILAGRATACLEAAGGRVIVTGSPELVEYTYYLLRAYYPVRDRLRRTLGDLYQMQIRGLVADPAERERLHAALREAHRRHFGVEGVE